MDPRLKIIIFILNIKKLSYHEKLLIIDIERNKNYKNIRD